tara:strand:+ start:139 stop:417 length:279 start_codon:yes stop_codon:yes gene_type:complete
MKITRLQIRKLIKEVMSPATGHMSRPDAADEVIQKALTVFPEALVDEDEMGEITIDTGLRDDEVEALYAKWIELFPNGEMGEGGLIYTGIPS